MKLKYILPWFKHTIYSHKNITQSIQKMDYAINTAFLKKKSLLLNLFESTLATEKD